MWCVNKSYVKEIGLVRTFKELAFIKIDCGTLQAFFFLLFSFLFESHSPFPSKCTPSAAQLRAQNATILLHKAYGQTNKYIKAKSLEHSQK